MVLQVVEECRISPPTGSVLTKTLPLTFLDLPWFAVPPVQRLFFYQVQISKTHFMDSILPNIKASLSLTLQHFYPRAGHITWPFDSTKPEIQYIRGDSISLTVAESNQDFHHISANYSRDATDFHLLAPNFGPMAPTHKPVPLLCLQVTLFPHKGICVGITANHIAADGRTSTLFMKSWASACKLQHNSLLLPFYDRSSVLEDKKEIEQILLNDLARMVNVTKHAFNNSIVAIHPIDKVRATFIMSKLDIIRLKKWVFKEKQIPEQLRLTTFVLTCAYVWACLVKARFRMEDEEEDKEEDEKKEHFGFAVDCKDQLSPPLPVTYFGNCFKFCVVTGSRAALIHEDGVATAAVLIAKAIHNIRNELWTSVETFFSMLASVEMDHAVSLAGSPKLAVYDTDFGWENPTRLKWFPLGTEVLYLSVSAHMKKEL